jgi:predicted metal-dependent hydrolase
MFGLDLGSFMTSTLQANQQMTLMTEQVKLVKDLQGPDAEVVAESKRLVNVKETDKILESREESIEKSMDKLAAQTTQDPWLVKLIQIKQDRYEATATKNT